MKLSKNCVRTKATAIPELRFEDHRLTSFAGLVVIQKFFQVLSFKRRLQQCFRHVSQGKIFNRATLFMQLEPPTHATTRKRAALWQFERVSTIRRTVLQRAGRLSTPSGKLVLTFCTGKNLRHRVLQFFEALAA